MRECDILICDCDTIVCVFSQTDTASVLSESIEYIKILHDQVLVSFSKVQAINLMLLIWNVWVY